MSTSTPLTMELNCCRYSAVEELLVMASSKLPPIEFNNLIFANESIYISDHNYIMGFS